VAGFLIYLFGLGAFWIPILFLIISLHTFKGYAKASIILAVVGGLLLAVTTGGLLSMHQRHYVLFGNRFSSGGILGIPLAEIVVKYSKQTGGLIFLSTVWTIAFIMATRLSLIVLLKWTSGVCSGVLTRVGTAWMIWRERRNKAKKLAKASYKPLPRKKSAVKVVARPTKRVKEISAVRQEVFEFIAEGQGFRLPPIKFLEDSEVDIKTVDSESLQMQSKLLEKKLSDFDVSGKVVAVSPGRHIKPLLQSF